MARPAIDPVVWQPPAAPARARQPRGDREVPPLTVLDVVGRGPEDVLFDDAGRVLCGVEDGRVLRLTPDGRHVEVLADTGGRPLGLEWLPDGGLLVCDARRGLLRVTVESGLVETLVDGLAFCNNAAVAPDGTIYFSDSTSRIGIDHWKGELLQHSGTGRLLRRGLGAETTTLLEGLQFANGVALAADESCVFYAETGGYRLNRLRLTGDRAGESEVVLDNLPGFPDNLSLGDDGLIWMAMASPRQRIVDALAPAPAPVRRAVWAVPEALQPHPKLGPWVMGVDPASGGIVYDLQGYHPRFGMTTGVRQHKGRIWLGSLYGDTIVSFPIPA